MQLKASIGTGSFDDPENLKMYWFGHLLNVPESYNDGLVQIPITRSLQRGQSLTYKMDFFPWCPASAFHAPSGIIDEAWSCAHLAIDPDSQDQAMSSQVRDSAWEDGQKSRVLPTLCCSFLKWLEACTVGCIDGSKDRPLPLPWRGIRVHGSM